MDFTIANIMWDPTSLNLQLGESFCWKEFLDMLQLAPAMLDFYANFWLLCAASLALSFCDG